MKRFIIGLNICLQQEDELPKWRSLTVCQAVPWLWDLQTNVQEMKAKLHLPSPSCCPGSMSLLSAVRSTAQTTHAGRKHLVQLYIEPVSWDCCQGHHAARGRSADYLSISLTLSWGQWEGKQCRRPEEDFFFLLNCLKRQSYWNSRRGMILRKREKSSCCFRTSFLVFTLIYSGNLPQDQWQSGMKQLKEELQMELAAFGVSPCRW